MPPTKKKSPTAAERKRRERQSTATAPAEEPKNLGRGGGWRKGSELEPQELKLPSGATCLVITPRPEDLIISGVADQMDVLTSKVQNDLVAPVSGPMAKKRNILGAELTGQQLLDAIELADRVTVAVCISPVVLLAPVPQCTVEGCGWEGANLRDHKPEDGHDLKAKPRDPDAYYTDGVSIVDKLAILQWAMEGPKALARFPGEAKQGVDDVPASEDVALPPERATTPE